MTSAFLPAASRASTFTRPRTAVLEGSTWAVVDEDASDVLVCAIPTQVAFSDRAVTASGIDVSYYLEVLDLRYISSGESSASRRCRQAGRRGASRYWWIDFLL